MQNYENMTDIELLDEIRQSNIHAFKHIYFKYYESLCQFVAMKTNSIEFADTRWTNSRKVSSTPPNSQIQYVV